ncbi:hypothetical protein NGRA_0147 [Nosema granulosis]|uniref:L-type lectin-like domain-containing protein n=1 Tax=Nosema granulosis TaxID=83296 RepID=A0A9P6H0V2_9MICR|nr:hypothetical protein NGRA_0147 [Nosema granulosis]
MLQIIFNLLSVFCDEKIVKEELFFLAPYVNSKGNSSVARFLGDFCVRSHGKGSQFVQLGYLSPGSTGAMVYKNKIDEDKFNIEVELSVLNNNSRNSGAGMMIFISKTDDHESGSFYGKSDSFEGLCIVVDTSNHQSPFVSASAGIINGFSKQLSDNKKYIDLSGNDKCKFRIVQTHKVLEVFLSDGHNEIKVLSTRRNLIERGSYLGVCASNSNNGQYSYMVNKIEVSYLKGIKHTLERGEHEGSSKPVWFVFILAVGCIGFYLYTMHKK